MLRLLVSLQLPSRGELRLFGQPQIYLRLDQTDRPPSPCVPGVSELGPFGMLTVEENIGFLLREDGQVRPAEIRERVEACL